MLEIKITIGKESVSLTNKSDVSAMMNALFNANAAALENNNYSFNKGGMSISVEKPEKQNMSQNGLNPVWV